MGTRDPAADGGLRWLTFREIERRAQGFACSLYAELGGDLGAEGMVGILGENCVEWLLGDLACILGGRTTIPIDPPTPEAAIRSVVEVSTARQICSARLSTRGIRLCEAANAQHRNQPYISNRALFSQATELRVILCSCATLDKLLRVVEGMDKCSIRQVVIFNPDLTHQLSSRNGPSFSTQHSERAVAAGIHLLHFTELEQRGAARIQCAP